MSSFIENLALNAMGPVYPRYPFRTPYHDIAVPDVESGYPTRIATTGNFASYFLNSTRWKKWNRWVQQLEAYQVFYQTESTPLVLLDREPLEAGVPTKDTDKIVFSGGRLFGQGNVPASDFTSFSHEALNRPVYHYGDVFSINLGGFKTGDILRLKYENIVPFTKTYPGTESSMRERCARATIVPNFGGDVPFGPDSYKTDGHRLRRGTPLSVSVKGDAYRASWSSQELDWPRYNLAQVYHQTLGDWVGPMRLDCNGSYLNGGYTELDEEDRPAWLSERWFLNFPNSNLDAQFIAPSGLCIDYTEILPDLSWIPESFSGQQEYRFETPCATIGLMLHLFYASGTVTLEIERHPPTGGTEGPFNLNNRLGFTEEPDNQAGYP